MVRYRLDELGWVQFEELCQSVLKARFAVAIESWGKTADHGRDASFLGRLPIPDTSAESTLRSYVFQAKFVHQASAAGAKPAGALRKAVNAEMERMEGKSAPDCYVLMTNAPLTTSVRAELRELLQTRLPASDIVMWGADDICDVLDALPKLRTSYPVILGIRDLQFLVLDSIRKPHQERARAFLERARECAASFAPTRAYYDALDRLAMHSMVLLSGPPEMGKTTAALVIGLAKAEENWQCFECRTPADFFQLYDDGAPQLFVADDAFGTTEYVPRFAEDWAAGLDAVLRRLNSNHWFIWTSRTAPLGRALKRMNLQGKAEHFPSPGEVTVNAGRLTVREKALMLYRHARSAGLTQAQRDVVRANAGMIVANDHFTPKRVERFTNEWLKKAELGTLTPAHIRAAIDDQIRAPTDGMRKSFDALQDSHKRFLVSMLDAEPRDIAKRYALLNRGENTAAPKAILGELTGHFVNPPPRSPEAMLLKEIFGPNSRATTAHVTWTHPSWRDLVIDYLTETPDERRRFLEVCGLAGLELALSTAGGATGERTHPLLRAETDWKAVSQRIPSLVAETDDDDVGGLITTLTEAIDTWASEPEERTVQGWAAKVLELVRERWRGRVIALKDLRAYCTLSELLKPLSPLPDVSGTWAESLAEARQEAVRITWRTGFGATHEWLELIELIQQNEPRFLRQVGFPSEYEGFATALLDDMEHHVRDAEPHTASAGDYELAIDQLESLSGTASKFGEVFRDLRSQSRAVSEVATDKAETLRDRAPAMPKDSSAQQRAVSDDKISIEQLFRDL